MAERRMFAKTIIDSDAFLDMPLSTQALYFHLSMRADDDGFINNAKKIQRMLGCTDDDMKILLSKNFVIPFETGVCVIKHWKIHNLIQKDRYKPTIYNEHKNQITLKDNNVYTLDTICIQDVSSLETQVSIGKDSLVKTSKSLDQQESEMYFEDFWYKYPKKVGKQEAIKAWKKTKPDILKVIDALNWQIPSKQWQQEDGKYIPNPATYLNQGRWEDENPDDSYNDIFAGAI
ncbi:MAG: hypothetical protein ACR2IJ_02305 [Fluviibacter sp.]